MKKRIVLFTTCLILLLFIGSSFPIRKEHESVEDQVTDTLNLYKDGTYHGQSRATYTVEPYWGSVQLTIKNRVFTRISFIIRDSALHENFDGSYGKHFQGNQVYVQQCMDDWTGVQTYPRKLAELQDINKVDVISGATWSYNIFRATVNEALKKAR
jgi:major membrane immunogen (membrane-anchored lipoprotein)